MKFSIVYNDLSVVRGETKEDWQAAPSFGVQYVLLNRTDGTEGLYGDDFYYYLTDFSGQDYIWSSNDPNPQLRYLEQRQFLHRDNPDAFTSLGFKYGLTISDEQFEKCREIAQNETDLMQQVG